MKLLSQPASWVDPNIGTVGHLLKACRPIVALPHGAVQTYPVGDPQIEDVFLSERFFGFAAGGTVLTATGDSDKWDDDSLVSMFDHDMAIASPYYYKALLEDCEVRAEATAQRHSLFFRFSFPPSRLPCLLLRLPAGSGISMTASSLLQGQAEYNGATQYFTLSFSAPIHTSQMVHNLKFGDKNESGVRLWFTNQSQPIEVRGGYSYISTAQAQKNMEATKRLSFDDLVQCAMDEWNCALGRIEVEGGTEKQRTIFYTAMYRSLLYMQNVTEEGHYYSGTDGTVHAAGNHDFYTMDNIWDSYRCVHPLQLLIEPSVQQDMAQSFVRMAQQGDGCLARFPDVSGDRPIMLGNHTIAMLLDTWVKGANEFDFTQAYTAMRKSLTERTLLPWRDCALTELDIIYRDKGFLPALEPGERETVNQVHPFERRQAVAVTLETAYDDWCTAQAARLLGIEEDCKFFSSRADNYRNLYCAQTGFMSPKNAEGDWIEDFDPKNSGGLGGRDYFAECNSWVYSFFVPHDLPGLISLVGGKLELEKKLDRLFEEQYDGHKYKFLAQFPDATGLVGQYCQGNEPAFHIPYLYNVVEAPWKAQRRVRQLMDLWYQDTPLGICGDDDEGAMSAWYVFSAMGFYPACPGSARYEMSSPIFTKVTIHQENGNAFTIEAPNASQRNKYIQAAWINGKEWNKSYFEHQDFLDGATITLSMADRPCKSWGIEKRES